MVDANQNWKPMENNAVIQTRATYNTQWISSFAGNRCELFERKWLECASQLGRIRAERECMASKDDLNECVQMNIAYKRYLRMQEERQKKGLPYQDPPPYDTIQLERFKNPVH